jgi:hypothetical protein
MAHVRCPTLCYRKLCAKGGGANDRGVEIRPLVTLKDDLRILVALEDDYRAYREVIAAALHVLRPHVEVATIGLDALKGEVTRLDPHVVISDLPATAGSGDRLAWVQLSLDPTRPTKLWMGESYLERKNPTLEVLLEAVDEAERLVGKESNTKGS